MVQACQGVARPTRKGQAPSNYLNGPAQQLNFSCFWQNSVHCALYVHLEALSSRTSVSSRGAPGTSPQVHHARYVTTVIFCDITAYIYDYICLIFIYIYIYWLSFVSSFLPSIRCFFLNILSVLELMSLARSALSVQCPSPAWITRALLPWASFALRRPEGIIAAVHRGSIVCNY